jgi:hypothetical protein
MLRMQAAREALLMTIHTEVCAYLSDPELTFDADDDFPNVQRLTGDYYLGDESYDIDPETGRSHVWVEARCLAHPLPQQSHPDDYLGLTVWLAFNPERSSFSICRNTDSAVI